MDLMWVPHEAHSFVPASFKGDEGGNRKFQGISKEFEDLTWTRPAAEKMDEYAKVKESQLQGAANVCTLEEVHVGALLHTVRVRYLRGDIYTCVSKILLATNPFKALPLYGSEQMDKYLKCADSVELPPHIYGIGCDAMSQLRSQRTPQAVLIAGESGAGKTESQKHVLSFVTTGLHAPACEGNETMQDKIMNTNPILESFGNAMTLRNNNSSRFGKWLEMGVEPNKLELLSCNIKDYILEVSRVVAPGPTERNYHIFFQLVHNRARKELADLGIQSEKDYNYTKGCLAYAPGIDDSAFFDDLNASFSGLGFSPNTQAEIYKVVLAIMELGNVEFGTGDDAVVADPAKLNKCATTLGVPADKLTTALIMKRLVVGKEVTLSPQNPAQAVAARDGMSRLIYGKIFKWLIDIVNKKLSTTAEAGALWVGILDIAGFESFATNSLEQLNINLTNEHLQQHFNIAIFKNELDDYKAEEVKTDGTLTYPDNSDILALLDQKGGLYSMLDEETSLAKGSDKSYLEKVYKTHEKNKRVIKPKKNFQELFGLRHFAGDVTYTITGFFEKNKDRPPPEAPDLLCNSSLSVAKELGEMMNKEIAEAAPAGAGAAKKKAKTVTSALRDSLHELISKLQKAEPHFVKCIKPNIKKVPGEFEGPLALDQMTCSGVMEAVKIRQQGFACRIPYPDFFGRYKMVFSKTVKEKIFGKGGPADDKAKAALVKEALKQSLAPFGGLQDNELEFGKTKFFIKAKIAASLEKCRDVGMISAVIDIQRRIKGVLVRRKLKDARACLQEITKWETENNFYTDKGTKHTAAFKLKTPEEIEAKVLLGRTIVTRAEQIPLPMRVSTIKDVSRKMENEAKVLRELQAVAKSIDPMEIDKALSQAKVHDLYELGDVVTLAKRATDLKAQIPLLNGMKAAVDTEDLDQLEEVASFVAKEGLFDKPDNWVPELDGKTLAANLKGNLDKLRAKAKQEEEAAKKVAEEAEAAEKKAKQEAAAATKAAEAAAAAAAAANEADKAAAAAAAAAAAEAAKAAAEKEAAAKEETAKATIAVQETGEAPAEGNQAGNQAARKVTTKKNSKRVTIAGMTEDEQNKILLDLMSAMHECNMELIEQKLSDAMKQGVDSSKTAEVEQMFHDMQSEDFVVKKINEHAKDLEEGNNVPLRLKQLANLQKHAMTLNIDDSHMSSLKTAMQKGVKIRARETIKGNLFEHIDPAEIEALQGGFGDLLSFPNLRNPAKWKGHRSSRLFTSGARGADAMLVHSRNELREPLTKVPTMMEQTAFQVCKDMLAWMTDRPVPESQRVGLAQEIVNRAKLAETDKDTMNNRGCVRGMSDEIFMQIMKQLTKNPSLRSQMWGWRLLLLLVQQVEPSEDIEEYVRAFVMRSIVQKKTEEGAEEIVDLAKQVVIDLNLKKNPGLVQQQGGSSANEQQQLIPIEVHLVDNSTRKVFFPATGNTGELIFKMASELKIKTARDFALFQATAVSSDGGQILRLLPNHVELATLRQKWESLYQATHRRSKLVFKRKFIRVDETLDCGDPMHANLTFKQVITDYIAYPVAEEVETNAEIAGAIMAKDPDHFQRIIDMSTLQEAGNLGQVVPKICLESGKADLARTYAKLASTHYYKFLAEFKELPKYRMMKEMRIMSMIQRLKLFGVYHWIGKQTFDVPEDKISLQDAPKVPCLINPRDKKGQEWFICVDLFGVRFITVDSQAGKYTQRGFLYNEEALERITRWGAKQNVLQLEVRSVDQHSASGGATRMPMIINMIAPAACDIAYAIHAVCTERQQRVHQRAVS